MATSVANVVLWGSTIGAVSWLDDRQCAAFEYTPDFQRSGIELAPLTMPLGQEIFTFPSLARETFQGLPGLLADALPDKFGNTLIDQWLVRSGRDSTSFTPVERLCYVGGRAMGALEFEPLFGDSRDRSTRVDVGELTELAAMALAQKKQLSTCLTGNSEADLDAMRDILRVGTSAGGARAKAVIAWDEESGEVRSGQVTAPSGFSYWLLKFDGVSGNADKELDDPKGYGKIEYAYHLMAVDAGIEMAECRLYEEHGRSHFMTKRFDRTDSGEKIFMQSLCALGHFDFNQAGAYSYEQAIEIAQQLKLNVNQCEQLLKRAAFNIMARNQDDHTKNIAFLMNKSGTWRLAPAFDVIYSYNPEGVWTSSHQMSLNGKRDDFSVEDFRQAANRFRLFRGKQLTELLERIDSALSKWPKYAESAGVPEQVASSIAKQFRCLGDLR